MQVSAMEAKESLSQDGVVAKIPDILQNTFGYLASSVNPIGVIITVIQGSN
jgi:hypothetical protein